MVHELPTLLDVPQDRLCLAAALLGGNVLSEQSLTDFYKRLGINQKKVSVLKMQVFFKQICVVKLADIAVIVFAFTCVSYLILFPIFNIAPLI